MGHGKSVRRVECTSRTPVFAKAIGQFEEFRLKVGREVFFRENVSQGILGANT